VIFMKPHAAIVVALLALTATPAFAAANKEHLQLLAEIRMLQEQNQQLQALVGTLTDTLKTVTTKLDEQSSASRKAMADQTLAITNMGDNVRVLREKTDETNVRISTVSQEIDALRQAIASQPTPQAAPTAGGGGDPAGAAPGSASPATPSMPPGSISPQRMYDTSFDDYSAGRYDLAIQGFQAFIQAFPRTPNAASAQYNIGMSYWNQAKWTDAREAFQRVITDYPQQDDRVADAYYKLGQTFEHLNQIDNAKQAYQTLVQKYPSASGGFPATQAKAALDKLNKR
jgi:tol-pal system protein YbgF